MAKKDAKLSKEYSDKGWQLWHQQPALTANDSPTGAAQAGHFIALKRDANAQGEGPVELAAQDIDSLEDMISDWERTRPVDPSSQPQPDEKQLLNSAEATVHSLISAGAKASRDVDLTPASEKAKPKAARVSSSPPVDTEKLSPDDAALVADIGTGASKVEGVGTGTKPGP